MDNINEYDSFYDTVDEMIDVLEESDIKMYPKESVILYLTFLRRLHEVLTRKGE